MALCGVREDQHVDFGGGCHGGDRRFCFWFWNDAESRFGLRERAENKWLGS